MKKISKNTKKIIVTGGAGFIGSHVTEFLCDRGFQVTVLDDLSTGYKKFVDPRAAFVKGSFGDRALTRRVLRGADAVMHLAAFSIISLSLRDPALYFENNLGNGIVLLDAMRAAGVKKIIYSSTAAVYGEPKRIPIREDDPKQPVNPYGASKLAFEEALVAYYHSFGIESVSLRYFNAYGPRDEQQPATRAVPRWIRGALRGSAVTLNWGGRQRRDYVFVRDIAEAHLKVLPLSGFRTYNVGSGGEGVVMKELLREIGSVLGKKLQVKDCGMRAGDPMRLVADISKIKREVGWEPKTSLREGLQETVEYYRNAMK